ncbi:MatE family protein [Tritrichomonas foetus]|uniref:MatE family protein n=1 Tax=Tritrichomonas foetus TaxID=1144522 RepID=A0A1J4KFZ4_9EUKA|nr:MatE family protein [Tritrichomonas foetus]|eukprot:OHT09864.1 MatE family protein [Tritrichomonas foetus]
MTESDYGIKSDESISLSGESDQEKRDTEAAEQFRLGGRTPLSTICHLMVGPLFSQLAQSFYGLMDSFWISRSIGTKGMTVMGIILVVDFINIAFAQFFNVAMSTRISFLFGRKMKEECAQVVVDLLRMCVLIGILVPAVLIPCVKPLMRWYGGNDEIVDMCLDFLLPALCCSMINYTYLSLCGLLQAMGNSVIYGICQVTSAILNMAVFDPLFLLGFKTGMWGASLATALSNFFPMIILYILLFRGKFVVKPKFSNYVRKFNPHCWSALRVSVSQFIANLASSLPVLLLSKLVAQSSTTAGIYTEAMAAWNVQDRLYVFAICVCNGLNQGFLPAASFAYGSNRLNRLLHMFGITILIGTCWTTLVCILITTLPQYFAKIWGSDEKFIDVTSKMLRIGFASCFLNQIILTTTACLQAMKMVTLSIVTSILTMLIPIPIFSLILYYTKKDDPVRLIFSFIGHDIWALSVTIIIIIWKLRFLWKAPKDAVVLAERENANQQYNGSSSSSKSSRSSRSSSSSGSSSSSYSLQENQSEL